MTELSKLGMVGLVSNTIYSSANISAKITQIEQINEEDLFISIGIMSSLLTLPHLRNTENWLIKMLHVILHNLRLPKIALCHFALILCFFCKL